MDIAKLVVALSGSLEVDQTDEQICFFRTQANGKLDSTTAIHIETLGHRS